VIFFNIFILYYIAQTSEDAPHVPTETSQVIADTFKSVAERHPTGG